MDKMGTKKLIKRLSRLLLYVMLGCLLGIFIFNILLAVNIFSQDSNRLTEDVARDFKYALNDSIDDIKSDFVGYKELCDSYDNNDNYVNLIEDLKQKAIDDKYLGFTLFTNYGEEHTATNKFYESFNSEYVNIAIAQQKSLYYLYFNKSANEICVSFYLPLNSGNGINLISGIKSFNEIIAENKVFNWISTEFDGVIYIVDNGGIPSNGYMRIAGGVGTNKPGYIFALFDGDYLNEEIKHLSQLKDDDFGTIEISEQENKYTLTKTGFGQCAESDIYLKLDKTNVIKYSRGDFMKVIVSMAITFILFVIIIVLVVIKWRKTIKDNYKRENTVEGLNCSTESKFLKDAENILLNNRSQCYVMVSITNPQVKYVAERFGSGIERDFRAYGSQVIGSVLKSKETYCWLEQDIFILLLNCEFKSECVSKITLIREVCNQYETFRRNNFSVQFSTGLYFIKPNEEIDIKQFIERANIAMLANKQNPAKSYNEFTAELYTEYSIQQKIEAKMESALKNEEFFVFFQPKYNIKQDKLDGAETLIRWYDKERDGFITPAKFVKVFEINGFINKLDRYVFVKTCEFLAQAVRNGLRVTPISVNVSRVTATQRDFISYYTKIKQKYNIPDGYITIEFTESFSFTDLNVLSNIVKELKKNGFACSIDDFGSGYSSCGILKELEMDELKLDIFLLKPTPRPEKDKALIKFMIDLGKSFDMKVTQEGVETIEQFNMLVGLGCDVIQGFLYSKPLIADDFLTFINGKTDLKTAIENGANNTYKPINYIDFTDDKEKL